MGVWDRKSKKLGKGEFSEQNSTEGVSASILKWSVGV